LPSPAATAEADAALNAEVVSKARSLMRSGLADELQQAGLPWVPSVAVGDERAAEVAEPAYGVYGLAENEEVRKDAGYVLAVAGLVALIGGYEGGWKWTSFQANGHRHYLAPYPSRQPRRNPLFAHQFHHTEILAVDSAFKVIPVPYHYPDQPRKTNSPHRCDQRDWRAGRGAAPQVTAAAPDSRAPASRPGEPNQPRGLAMGAMGPETVAMLLADATGTPVAAIECWHCGR
jgi:hypothetical protein